MSTTTNFVIAPTLPEASFGLSVQRLVHDHAPRFGLMYASFDTAEIAERLDSVRDDFEALLEGTDEFGAYVHDAEADESLTRGLALLKFVVEDYAPTFGTVPELFRREPIAPVKVMTADGVTVARRTVLDDDLVTLVDAAADYMRERADNGSGVIVDTEQAGEYFRDRCAELGTTTQVTGALNWGGGTTVEIESDSELARVLSFVDWNAYAADEFDNGPWVAIEHEGRSYHVEQE